LPKSLALSIHHFSPFNEVELVGADCSIAEIAELKQQIVGNDGLGGSMLECATGGSLYLQSADQLDLEAQGAFTKLLEAVGHQFRLICSSEADLEEKMDAGDFSHELFYKNALSVI
tara:strand:+ start:1832 stop:2179 length:348 start_codon:yes stop_codon:yes gene_type:complete